MFTDSLGVRKEGMNEEDRDQIPPCPRGPALSFWIMSPSHTEAPNTRLGTLGNWAWFLHISHHSPCL